MPPVPRALVPAVACLSLTLLAPPAALAHPPFHHDQAGSLVSVTVEVAGRSVPLYRAPDGSGRFYLEAFPHAPYALRLANNSHERLGVVVAVDGLNAISGEREETRSGRPGRMYVLGPWDTVEVQGWRRSLHEVRRFTFVDERGSYAARTARANRKMGWIEVAVHRERHASARVSPPAVSSPDARDHAHGPPAREKDERAVDATRSAPEARGRTESYPGTGWGSAAYDPAMVVHFDPQPHPAERVTLRYEYASGLRALGIPVEPREWARDRLRERDRAEDGFARPPRW